MHAILRHRVVIHVHSVNTIAWAIRLDGEAKIEERLAGLKWCWIPYVKSGVPLARQIEKRLAKSPGTDVLVLGNHGLVICGDDCDAAEALLSEVERRLAIIPRQPPGPARSISDMVARSAKWRFPDLHFLHALGTDEASRRIFGSGVLYPCQAIFLGSRIPVLSQDVLFSNSTGHLNAGRKTRPFLVVEGCGVQVNENISYTELANLIALTQVLQRTSDSTPIRYLTAAEVKSVLSQCARTYRAAAMRSEPSYDPLQMY
jgi:hypothetical protein